MNLEKITDIDQSKVSLLFLQSRIIREDYRGLQLSQHNRYTFDQVKEMLKVLYDMFGEKMLTIRTADLKKRPENLKEEIDYAKMIQDIKRITLTEPKINKDINSGSTKSASIYNGIDYEYDGKKVKKQTYQGCWD